MASASQLSLRDTAVFSALFDPEASLTNTVHITKGEPGFESLPEELEAIQILSSPEPKETDIYSAISKLDALIKDWPNNASLYVNRAQARRFLIDFPKDMSPSSSPLLSNIIQDLSKAIEIAAPKSPSEPITEHLAQILASAHVHRGYLIYVFSRPTTKLSIYSTISSLAGLAKDDLEEMASRDFAAGGRYGNPIAREMSVRTNPYANLCGSIVKEAMRREIDQHFGSKVEPIIF